MTARAPEMPPLSERRARYAFRRTAGICTRAAIHGPAAPGHTLCSGCLADERLDRRERSVERNPNLKLRACHRCGESGDGHNARGCLNDPLPGWRGTDPRKLARHKRRNTAHRAAGLCIANPNHEKPRDGKARCEACLARRRKASS